jgi:chromosome segregation ATPase
MATEQQIILKVGTDEAVKSVGDLKENIKLLKGSLNDLEIGSEEYSQTLNQLKLNQNALKDSMYATSSTMDEVAESAAGMSESYNSLVHRMAALKEEWRSTNDEARRNELGVQINSINDKLKSMDASTGNFSRNVGDYKNQMVSAFTATSGAAGAVINPLKNMNAGLTAISSTPVIAILGLLANVIMKIIQNLNSSEGSMNRVKMAMAPFSASTTALTKIFQWLGDKVADVVEWLGELADRLGLVSDEMKEHQAITQEEIALQQRRREVEEANADAQLEIAKLRAQAAEKDKYTAKERLEFIEAAAKKEREIADRNIEIARREYDVLKRKADLAENSAEENDALSEAYVKLQNAETNYFNKSRELSAQRVEAINQIKAETKANEDLLKSKKDLETFTVADETDADIEAALAEEQKYMEEQQRLADHEIQMYLQRRAAEKAEREARTQAAHEEAMAHAQQLWEEQEREREAAEERKKLRVSGLMDIAAATSDILGSIADSMNVNNEKEFKRQQGLQIAQVTINTPAGAVGAFMQAMATYPAPAGAIIGAVQAAAATAAGIAQIAKIKQQKYSKNGSSSGSASSGSVAAPNVQTTIPTQRTLTSASEEDRLNRMAAPTRAYIVDSDLQAKEQQRETVETETSF